MSRSVVAHSLLALGGAAAMFLGVHAGRHPGAFRAPAYGETRILGNGFPKTLSNGDSLVALPAPPRRIASLAVTSDEILSRLVRSERLAAVTHFADDDTVTLSAGRIATDVARVRGVNPEGVVALEPDLAIVAHYTLDSATRILGSAGVPIVRLRPVRSFRDVEANVALLGKATGEEGEALALLAEMRTRLARVEGAVRGRGRPRVLYYSGAGYTTGAGTLVHEKIERAGCANAAAEAGVSGDKNVSLDLLVGLDPEIIVVPRWSLDGGPAERVVTEGPAFRDVRAVRERKVRALAASVLTSESPDGVIGVEALARLCHPEAFSS